MRRLIIVLAALAIMIIGFVASLAMLADQGRLKELLSAHVENQLGRQLQIDGAVSLSFFPRLRIQAGDVRLSGSEEFQGLDLLASDEISAEIRLLPLILGRVEAAEVAMRGASLNLLFDEDGGHNFSGLLSRRGRDGAPGILVDGPVRLENLALQISHLGTESVQRLSVERMELDGLAFDRALSLVFEGAIGIPAVFEDVTVTGVLFVPGATGRFRLSDMILIGRRAGAELPFRLSGELDFSAQPPLEMKLSEGQLRVGDQQLQVAGRYEARTRPFFGLDVSGDVLNMAAVSGAFGRHKAQGWPQILAGWTAAHDYELGIHLDRLELGMWPLTEAAIRIDSAAGLARIEQARAGLPGGTIEVLGDLVVDSEASLLSAQARIEIDQLSSTLASAGIPLRADGVGQLLIEPADGSQPGALVQGSLRFFDGWVRALADLRVALGAAADPGYDALEGRFVAYPGRIEFPDLRVFHAGEELAFQRFSVAASRDLSGVVVWRDGEPEEKQMMLGGTLAQPSYSLSVAQPQEQ
ncbi:MAG: AsmA family protein [Wenzhouxiangella sp.]|jgi:hypothetical protein|nr:AsmA family protein [Wenzhouxiangella sp.]